jgi:hypothetical protein
MNDATIVELAELHCDPATVDTPLQPVFSKILEAPMWAAPRSERRIAGVIAQHGIRLLLHIESHGFQMEATADTDGGSTTNRIVIGLGTTERIWAFVFAYTFLFLLTAKAGTKSVNVRAVPNGFEALQLLQWALLPAHASCRQPWPGNAPSPSYPLADAALMQRVNGIFLAVIGWMTLHEVGHFENGDLALNISTAYPPRDPHLEEFFADDWASASSLTGAVDLDYQQRACVIPFALGILAAINHRETDSHPAVKARLTHYVQKFINPLEATDPKCFTTALATAIIPLQALLFACGKLPETRAFPSWSAYIDNWDATMG